MGNAAGKEIETQIIELLKKQDEVRMIFAAAPSQNEVLEYLKNSPLVDWSKIIAFHMDEYIDLPLTHRALFSNLLTRQIFDHVPIKVFHKINSLHQVEKEILRYEQLIKEKEIDICIMGIGENGHIAFNDPPYAKFDDPYFVKKVELDNISRQQQVNDGCFETLEEVPEYALTLTIPALLSVRTVYCIVPGPSKTIAMKRLINEEVNEDMPATILKTIDYATVYTDESCLSGM